MQCAGGCDRVHETHELHARHYFYTAATYLKASHTLPVLSTLHHPGPVHTTQSRPYTHYTIPAIYTPMPPLRESPPLPSLLAVCGDA